MWLLLALLAIGLYALRQTIWTILTGAGELTTARALAAVGLFAGFIFGFGIEATNLWDSDEGDYANVAGEMLESGDWVVPHNNGQPWLEKPPLAYWLMAASCQWWGVNEIGMRFPSTVLMTLTAVLVCLIGTRLYDLRTGAAGGLVFATGLLAVLVGKVVLMDPALVFLMTLAVYALLRAWESQDSWTWPVVLWASLGLGFLAKSLVAPVLVGGIAIVYAVWNKTPQRLWRMRPFLGVVIFLAVVLPWAVWADLRTGGQLVRELILKNTVGNVVSARQGHGGKHLLQYFALLPYYIPVLLAVTFPWGGLIPGAFKRTWDERSALAPRFLLVWVSVPFVVFSLVSTKLPHYILPVWPALAIMIARWLRINPLPAWWEQRIYFWGTALLGLGGGLALVVMPYGFGFKTAVLPCLVTGVAMAAFTWACCSVWKQHLYRQLFPVGAIGLSACVVVVTWLGAFALDRYKVQPVLGKIARAVGAQETGYWGPNMPSVRFYAGHKLTTIHSSTERNNFIEKMSREPGKKIYFFDLRAMGIMCSEGTVSGFDFDHGEWVDFGMLSAPQKKP